MSVHASVEKPSLLAKLNNSTKEVAFTTVAKAEDNILPKTIEENAPLGRLQEARKVLAASHKVPTPNTTSPTDSTLSPCTKKLTAMKLKRYARAKPRFLGKALFKVHDEEKTVDKTEISADSLESDVEYAKDNPVDDSQDGF
ncbi:9550_t:CDS:2 [Paraglomus occultum]|uniref:9550_t:CDS:1 n=1 Tax=Paraglomus occultum TaxID=144539 RepID=A0A9N9BH53_9GLOM|nr:9550_t:CDS:2 [Paraglomus occultum]